ncbi:MAG TPA: Fe-S cluster assembly protein SufD [Anaerolineales bacterium]|nr:Fe-S cluster assembly protein SufD [Anaerolineales bacterium]
MSPVSESRTPSRTVTRRSRDLRPRGVPEFPFTEADVRQVSTALGEPAWLLQRRLEAWKQYQSTPMPTLQDEAWRRTDLSGLPSNKGGRRPVEDLAVDRELLQPLAGEAGSALMVVRPGFPPQREGMAELEAQGVLFLDWATAVSRHAEFLKEHLGSVVRDNEGKFGALAAALAEDGVVVYVPPGVEAALPVHSVLWAPAREGLHLSRVLVVVDRGSTLTYVHEAASPTEAQGQSIHAGIVEVSLREGARLTFVELQSWGVHVWNFTHERARLGRNAALNWIFGAVGSHVTKNFTEIDLVGEGAEGRMSGFYFADGDQHLDHDTQQNHLAPHGTSDLLFKGALLDRSRSVWQGMIYVAPGAQKTDGYQANRNLVLSPHARADSIPGLEILADDVRCTHGATVGQLEAEPIFYLMSRGLPRREAERLVVDGFFAPVLERVPLEKVRERFARMIDMKMSGVA